MTHILLSKLDDVYNEYIYILQMSHRTIKNGIHLNNHSLNIISKRITEIKLLRIYYSTLIKRNQLPLWHQIQLCHNLNQELAILK